MVAQSAASIDFCWTTLLPAASFLHTIINFARLDATVYSGYCFYFDGWLIFIAVAHQRWNRVIKALRDIDFIANKMNLFLELLMIWRHIFTHPMSDCTLTARHFY